MQAGKVVEPSLESFGAAASNADFKTANRTSTSSSPTSPATPAWPIAASTWVLIHKAPDDAAATGEALKFFAWAYAKDGKETAKALDYVLDPRQRRRPDIRGFVEDRHPGRIGKPRLRRRANIALKERPRSRVAASRFNSQRAELDMSR